MFYPIRKHVAVGALLQIICIYSIEAMAAQEPMEIAIQTSSGSFKVGAPIALSITYSNISSSNIYLVTELRSRAELHDAITVIGGDGNPAPLTQLGRYAYKVDGVQPMGGWAYNCNQVTIGPGKDFTDVSYVSSIFDMTTPGSYTIFVERNMPTKEDFFQESELDRKGTVIKSNVITLQVTR